jgi:hypothetical protein
MEAVHPSFAEGVQAVVMASGHEQSVRARTSSMKENTR